MLISRLGKTNYKYDGAILHSLSVYEKAELKDKLIDYYHTHKKEIGFGNTSIKQELFDCFKNFQSKEMKNLLYFELRGNYHN